MKQESPMIKTLGEFLEPLPVRFQGLYGQADSLPSRAAVDGSQVAVPLSPSLGGFFKGLFGFRAQNVQ